MRIKSMAITAALVISTGIPLTARAESPAAGTPAPTVPVVAPAAAPALPAIKPEPAAAVPAAPATPAPAVVPAVKPAVPPPATTAAAPVAAPAAPAAPTSPGIKPGPAAAVPAVTAAPGTPAAAASPAVPPAAEAKTEKPAVPSTSVLERFRTYSGPRTPANLSALFSAPYSPAVRQLPEVVLSNGAVPVTVAVSILAQGNMAPSFAFNGARLMSSILVTKDQWLIVALPETGVMKADMILLSNGAMLEIPLSVAPPLPAGADLSEKAFIAFLGGAKPAERPLQDLNGDGRLDYQDDYIFTANYLVNKRTPPAETPTASTDPRASRTLSQADQDALQRFSETPQKNTDAATSATKSSTEGQGGLQMSSGFYTGAPAAQAVSTPAPVVVTVTPDPVVVTGGTGTGGTGTGGTGTGGTGTGGTGTGGTGTGGTGTGGTGTGGTLRTYVISDGTTSLRFLGTSNTPSELNMRNFKAKQQKEQLNPTAK